MNNSCIICEGITDCFLLEYMLIKAFQWEDSKERNMNGRKIFYKYRDCWSRTFFKTDRFLTIAEVNGVTSIVISLCELLSYNKAAMVDERYDNIVIFVDNDEEKTKSDWKKSIEDLLKDESIPFSIKNEDEYNCTLRSFYNTEMTLIITLVAIPNDDTGSLETFLLNSISASDSYDGEIISKDIEFVKSIDPEKKYLNHRRLFRKAEFDVYFSIRTPYKAFSQRRDILRNVPWEKYFDINKDFLVLKRISE